MSYRDILLPSSILAGTIIGAGMFSLPFVFNETGILAGLFYLLFFAAIYLLIYFLYGDLILRTPGEHRFVGYAKIYLGNWGFWSSLFIGLIQLFFVLTIYLILAPSFSRLLFGGNYPSHLLVFWALGSSLILFNTRRIALFEFLIVAGMAAIILLISGLGIKNFSALSWTADFSEFSAAGPILFALSGSLAVPEIVSYFRESKTPISFLKGSLALGGFLPAIAYALFVLGILGLSGTVSGDAVSGLIGRVPPLILVLMGVLGFLSLISSYIVVGLNTRKILRYDLSLSGWSSRFLVVAVPPALYFIGFQNFIETVDFVGSVFLPLESIFIIFMWLQANKKSEIPPMIAGRWAMPAIPALLLIFFTVMIYVIIK